jgi:nucleoside-diphosphate-sugar epimerase
MPDALQAIHQLMAASIDKLTVRTSYNIHGFSGTPVGFSQAISAHLGSPISISYQPDFRQAIANSWPASLEDAPARTDWGWKPTFDLDSVVADMLAKISQLMPH